MSPGSGRESRKSDIKKWNQKIRIIATCVGKKKPHRLLLCKHYQDWSEIPPSLRVRTLPQMRNISGHQVHELSTLKYVVFRGDLETDRKIHCKIAREKRAELFAFVLN